MLFAAGMFQFATIRHHHRPAQERVNNGSEATFFAFHVSPSYNFSEDFHLYYVRAKRIAERGWTDSLLYSRPSERPNYAAPLQVAYGWLALATEGSPRRYAILIFATLAFGWGALALFARRWLPRDFHSGSILLAVLVTVLFEAWHFIVSEPRFNSFGVWPVFRALRMSTMSWTSPVLVASLIGIASLGFDRQRWRSTLFWIGLMLAALLCTDNWAFAMAWTACGLVAIGLVMTAVASRVRRGAWPLSALSTASGLMLLVAISFWGHEQLNASLSGDALLRGGVGVDWQQAAPRSNVISTHEWMLEHALAPALIVLALAVLARRRFRSSGQNEETLALASWNLLLSIALLALASLLALDFAMTRRGMETFLRNQIHWRVDYCLLFVATLAVCEGVRTSVWRLGVRGMSAWTAAVCASLLVLFAYHNYRIHSFVTNVAARDFFLTADAQGMKRWLEQFDREHDRYELATASLELNYLCAYWTDADLLLPSGFPYHNGASTEEIESRTLRLLRLFNASEKSWLRFTKPSGKRFQDLWLESRAAASGEAYTYHLLHRWAYYRHADEEERQGGVFRRRIGKALCESHDARAPSLPEVILVDEVSRSIGQPDLENYMLAHRSGSIEAWVRSDLRVTTLAGTGVGEEIRR